MNSQLNSYFTALSLGLLLLLATSAALAQKPVLVSVSASDTGGRDNAFDPVVSANGRFVAFTKFTFDGGPVFRLDVVVRDLQNGTISLVSVNKTGTGRGNGDSFSPTISADGRFVAFGSTSSDLVANDSNGVEDIFVRDLQLGITTLVSEKRSGNDSGNGESFNATISSNGKVVVFNSVASNLVDIDNNNTNDVFARNLQTGITSIVSCNQPCTASGNGPSGSNISPDAGRLAIVSDDGRRVVFESLATNLLSVPDTNAQPDVFMRDLESGSTRLISANSTNTATANGTSRSPVISGNGLRVFFQTTGTNVTANDPGSGLDLVVRDLQTNTTSLVSVTTNNTGCDIRPDSEFRPFASDDGRYVVFQSLAPNFVSNDANTNFDAFRRDLQTNTTTLVSAIVSGGTSQGSFGFVSGISADGRFVCFAAGGGQFSALPGSIGLQTDVYVRDMNAGTTTTISTNASGTGRASTGAHGGVITDDGRFVIFEGVGSDMVPNETSGFNIFITAVNGRVEFETTALTVAEASGSATFTVKRNGNTSEAVTVQYTTADGSAKANSDFSPVTRPLTFAIGETTKTIVVPVIDDSDVELRESLLIIISDFTASGEKAASLSAAVLNIVDNDLPKISVNDLTIVEGDSGLATASFTLTLSAPVSQSVTVLANPTSGTANVNEDFTSFFPMQVIFPPGRTSQTFAVNVVGDRTFEDDETFTLNLVDPTNATIERSQGHGIIKNDDPFPSIAIANLTLSEPPTGTTQFNFLVTASNPSSRPITVQFATADGTAHAGSDYVQTAGTLTLSPLTTSETIPVPVNGDLIGETSKTFFVNLTNPGGATLANSQALGTILDYQLPVLLTEEGSQRAAAIDSVFWLRDPFPLTGTILGLGHQTRISLFALNIPPVPVGDLSRVTVHAEDELGNTHFVAVEFIGPVAGIDNLSQLIVRLPAFVGNARELRMKLIVLGGSSNTAPIRIAAP